MTSLLTLIRANSFYQRLFGLLAHPQLQAHQGLCLVPCAAIHTFGLRQPIDVVFLAADWRLLKQRHSVPPWRISVCYGAHIVIELPAGFCIRYSKDLSCLLRHALLEAGIRPKNL